MVTPPQCENIAVRLVPVQPDDADAGNVAVITFNRPTRANALSAPAYVDWLKCMNWAAEEASVRVVMLTGNGRFYCSGQELSPASLAGENAQAALREAGQVTEKLVDCFIDFPKLLIAAVNGPSYGFGATHLALCDAVYVAPSASMKTPFMELGFCAECCSSYLFPKIMGQSLANELILMGRQLNAEEMVHAHMASRLLPSENFFDRVLELALEAARLPPNAIRQSKALVRSEQERQLLKEVNHREMKLLIERMLSEECHQAVVQFLTKQQRLKRAASKSSKL
ncbi:ClpP/crotonase-like domain-containing protein [Thamnocephalis sphaerospora]|uniref:ClpP/crotonase-like domain-containing protein n=1 Tax=Thamnocephalis sphaerospora TaxID=78915 RepID=A0A4V1IW47_9FUNG|nr:ClpP/crotonase-like domain-containing protein [Thamnocephalis sphaerospora]|eukprot:RKP06299.1 ClpP/crotonase-like domain-containing protein [Thamnocephalis sphaerospora]